MLRRFVGTYAFLASGLINVSSQQAGYIPVCEGRTILDGVVFEYGCHPVVEFLQLGRSLVPQLQQANEKVRLTFDLTSQRLNNALKLHLA